MKEDWKGKGECPFCKEKDNFRPLTFGENLTGLVSGIFKFTSISDGVDAFTRPGEFHNFRCCSCKGEVHQCSGCKKIYPYQDVMTCPNCGYK